MFNFFFAEHDQAHLNEIQIMYTGIQIWNIYSPTDEKKKQKNNCFDEKKKLELLRNSFYN